MPIRSIRRVRDVGDSRLGHDPQCSVRSLNHRNVQGRCRRSRATVAAKLAAIEDTAAAGEVLAHLASSRTQLIRIGPTDKRSPRRHLLGTTN